MYYIIFITIWCIFCQFMATRKPNSVRHPLFSNGYGLTEKWYWYGFLMCNGEEYTSISYKNFRIYFDNFSQNLIFFTFSIRKRLLFCNIF